MKCKPRKFIPQCFAEPENEFQIQNWLKFFDFPVNFLELFSINLLIFGFFGRLLSKIN